MGRAQAQSTAPMRWSSIDPATSSGVASWSGTTLIHVHRLVAPSHRDWRSVLDGCTLVVMESTVSRRGRNISRQAHGAMVANSRVLQDAIRELGAVCVLRRPDQWRRWLGIRGDRARCKALARAQLRALVRLDPTLAAAYECAEDPKPERLDEVEGVMVGVSYQIEQEWRDGTGMPALTATNRPATAKECVR